MKDIRQKLLATFEVEHRDHVEQIRSLLAMMKTTSGTTDSPELEEAFRRAHSLKGAARAVDLGPVEGLAHRMETLFARVRQGSLPWSGELTGVVHQVLDASEDCMLALGGAAQPAAGVEAALQAIEQVLGMEPERKSRAAEPSPSAGFQPAETVRITAQNFNGLLRSAGAILAESQHQDQVSAKLAGLARDLRRLEQDSGGVRRAAARVVKGAPTNIELLRQSDLMESMERQLRDAAFEVASARRLHQRSLRTTQRLGTQLQRDVWRARMIPADGLLEGYRKMVRDLARDEGKEIEFQASSAGVHADRRVLEALKDPLMHALRNAVSHGIEPTQERTAKGKARAGSITLRIDTDRQRLKILVQDDGRGLDFARVADVAERQGILSRTDAAQSSPPELARLLFRPGFSTCRSVTEVSGRGMGLSVVYETVRRLQGDLDIQPASGGGTLLQISVPLSLATQRLLLVKCGGQTFAVPMHGISRLLRVRPDAVDSMAGKAVIQVDGQAVPVFSLHQWLEFESGSSPDQTGALPAVVLKAGGLAAFLVDSLLWECEAVIQELDGAAVRGGKASSGVLLDDGTVALVLNPAQLVESVRQAPGRALPTWTTSKQAPKASASILVVDDSMTTRMLEKCILEAHGYRVRIAVDGLEALEALEDDRPDLVIADIEMPRLDGFGLLEAMKKNPNLAHVPVIVVSSVESREVQQRGLSLGADAYIVKRKFDQEELLGVIRQIL